MKELIYWFYKFFNFWKVIYGLPDRKLCESLLKHNQQYHVLLVTMYLSCEEEQVQLSDQI